MTESVFYTYSGPQPNEKVMIASCPAPLPIALNTIQMIRAGTQQLLGNRKDARWKNHGNSACFKLRRIEPQLIWATTRRTI
ncbi:MAG: hypothetical protein R8G34_21565 [Paracoccaceae bacterium]|nr:hypothetical protein [Paracoccaceae bacterium]